MKIGTIGTCGMALAATLLAGCSEAKAGDAGISSKTAASSITTNENGSVSKTLVETSVTTNGNLITEHRRETRTSTDLDGNVLETSTSEYAQSYNVGDTGIANLSLKADDKDAATNPASFMGLKFGDVFQTTNTVVDPGEPALVRATFKPKKALPGFDDYYVYLTPKSHKVVKVCACAKDAVEPGGNWRRHYLIEALEKRYNTWARLCSFRLPYYAFDVAPDRYVTVCLAGASDDYETVISAWDNSVARLAAEEREAMREEALRNAREKRSRRVEEAQSAF